jgi:preprotein translocase subunit SecG
MLTFLLVLQAIIAASMIGVILMQKSEGGGLGVGGSPAGLLSARGAADFLTRTTAVLATAFVVLCIVIAAYAATRGRGGELDTSLSQSAAKAAPATAPAASGVPLDAGAATGALPPAVASDDPLAAAVAADAAKAQPKAADKTAASGGVPLEQ